MVHAGQMAHATADPQSAGGLSSHNTLNRPRATDGFRWQADVLHGLSIQLLSNFGHMTPLKTGDGQFVCTGLTAAISFG